MKTCIVTFAKGDKRYTDAQKRQAASLYGNFEGDYIPYFDESELQGCPTHGDVPYAFKAYAIQQAIKDGYDIVIWLDSVVYATQPLNGLIEYIKEHDGVFFDNIGHPLTRWISDECLSIYGKTREDVTDLKQIMACAFGVNVKSDFGAKLMNDYIEGAKNGAYVGGWKNHRHDQAVISLLLNNDIRIVNGHDTFFGYNNQRKIFNFAETVCLISK